MAVMNENGRSQGEILSACPRCDSPHDPEDSYCRRCGAALHAERVPMVPDRHLPAPLAWRQTMPVMARGAAVVAAGTLAEAILRRLLGLAFRRRTGDSDRQTRLPTRRQPEKVESAEPAEAAGGDDHVVTETFLFRRVRLRRRGGPGE